MSLPLVFMLSGQGSHYYHMGKEMYNKHPVFRHFLKESDAIVRDCLGVSVIDIMYDDNKQKWTPFDKVKYTTPAIVIVEYALYQVLLDMGLQPDFLLGTSLGELAATTLSGSATPETLLTMLGNTIDTIDTCSTEGCMIGILESLDLYYQFPELNKRCELAAINFDSHFVVSCAKTELNSIELFLKQRKIIYQLLPVSHGFHSSLLDPVENICRSFSCSEILSPPGVPFISSTYARQLKHFPDSYLWDVLRKPIQFKDTVREMEHKQPHIYLDLGPSGTLSTFVNNIVSRSESKSHIILSTFGNDMENLGKLKYLLKGKKQRRIKEKKMIAYVFPGQGAQKQGMGGELFDKYKDLTQKADAILGYSIKSLCIDNPDNLLNHTQYTQPALYVVNVLSYIQHLEDTGELPDFLAGHSLGEYNALYASGVFDFETGLTLVKERGRLMAQASGGGMAAIIGLDSDSVRRLLKENSFDGIDVANYNTPVQTVISGLKPDIERARTLFEKSGAQLYIPLKVSGAFHSRYMDSARTSFKVFLNSVDISNEMQIPVIANVTARPYQPSEIKETLSDQIIGSVQWTKSIRYIMDQGIDQFVEIGQEKILTGMIQIIRQHSEGPPPNGERVIINDSSVIRKTETFSDIKKQSGKTSALPENIDNSIISPELLGSSTFRNTYNLKYAYGAGAMAYGISSQEMVVKLGMSGLLGFLGTKHLTFAQIEAAVKVIQQKLQKDQYWGINLYSGYQEEQIIDLCIKQRIPIVEASGYLQLTPALVRYRLKGLTTCKEMGLQTPNKLFAKISRLEIAEQFLSPPPERIVNTLLNKNEISKEEAELSRQIPMVDSLIIETGSDSHSGQSVASIIVPAIFKLRETMKLKHKYSNKIHIGVAGGIGSPESALSAFVLGADFVITGSINQCTVEASTSNEVKDLLQTVKVQDTDFVPDEGCFEYGAKVQVLKKGSLFHARANKLYDIFKHHKSLESIAPNVRNTIQDNYFNQSFADVLDGCRDLYPEDVVINAEKNPKSKMNLLFRCYLNRATASAISGDLSPQTDYQVFTSSALGAFNQWVKGTEFENWNNRSVDKIAEKIIIGAAKLLEKRYKSFTVRNNSTTNN